MIYLKKSEVDFLIKVLKEIMRKGRYSMSSSSLSRLLNVLKNEQQVLNKNYYNDQRIRRILASLAGIDENSISGDMTLKELGIID